MKLTLQVLILGVASFHEFWHHIYDGGLILVVNCWLQPILGHHGHAAILYNEVSITARNSTDDLSTGRSAVMNKYIKQQAINTHHKMSKVNLANIFLWYLTLIL